MDKNILQQYLHVETRIKYLRGQAEKLRHQADRLVYTDYGIVGDAVSRGKKGKKPLGTVKISGFSLPEYQRMAEQLKRRNRMLRAEEVKLARLACEAEEFIASVSDIEMRNILSLHYIEGMAWAQVAHAMNVLYGDKNYTPDRCRVKHDRFIKSL